MKVLVLMGSPRKQGNTAALLQPFCAELESAGAEVETVWLYDKDIRPCVACRTCQKDWTVFGCAQQDDVQEIFDKVLGSDMSEVPQLRLPEKDTYVQDTRDGQAMLYDTNWDVNAAAIYSFIYE